MKLLFRCTEAGSSLKCLSSSERAFRCRSFFQSRSHKESGFSYVLAAQERPGILGRGMLAGGLLQKNLLHHSGQEVRISGA